MSVTGLLVVLMLSVSPHTPIVSEKTCPSCQTVFRPKTSLHKFCLVVCKSRYYQQQPSTREYKKLQKRRKRQEARLYNLCQVCFKPKIEPYYSACRDCRRRSSLLAVRKTLERWDRITQSRIDRGLLSTRQVAERLGLTISGVHYLRGKGQLVAIEKASRSFWFQISDVKQLAANHGYSYRDFTN